MNRETWEFRVILKSYQLGWPLWLIAKVVQRSEQRVRDTIEHSDVYQRTHKRIVTTPKPRTPEAIAKAKIRAKTVGAILNGTLRHPTICDRCGGPRPEKHHENYNDPLAIAWLCRACHTDEHKRLRMLHKYDQITKH